MAKRSNRCAPNKPCSMSPQGREWMGINYYSGGGAPALFVSNAGSGDESGSSADNAIPITSVNFASLVAGTTVMLNKGETYDIGDIDITVANITFDAYGTGENPILRGSEDISGLVWTDEGGGVWSTPRAVMDDWIWIGNECAKLAETARIPIVSRGSTTTITIDNADVSGFADIVGSYLVAKDKKFRLSQRVTVTDYNAGTGVITIDGEINVNSNIDLALYNKFEYFVGNNEWAWEAGELRVKAAASPATLNIRASSFDYCFKTTSNTKFRNLEFQEYFQFGVWSEEGVIDVQDCNFHDIRDTGVLIRKAVTGAKVNNNTFERIGNDGIAMRPVSNSEFNGNTFSAIGMQENYGWQTWTSGPISGAVEITQVVGTAIAYFVDLDDDTVDGSGNQFNNNTITNCAYNGISLNTGTLNKILRNTISDYMNRFDDGGGIYLHHYRTYDGIQEGTEVGWNIVYDGADGPQAPFPTAGIYADQHTVDTYIHDNVTYDNGDYGIFCNGNSHGHIIENNISRNNAVAQVFFNDTAGALYASLNGIVMTGNELACGLSAQRCLRVDSDEGASYNPFTDGSSDNNYYIQPFTTSIANTNKGSNRTLAQLKSDYSNDANSVYRDNASHLLTNETDAEVNGSLSGFSTHSVQLASASSQAITTGSEAAIQFERTDPFSIFLRFKRNGNPASVEVMFSNFGATNRGVQVSIQTNGEIFFELRNTAGTNRYQAIVPTGYMDNEWHSMLIIKPTAFADTDILMDGVSDIDRENDNLSATIVATDAWVLGNRGSQSVYMNGLLDQWAIWNSDQTANVATIINGGVSQNLALLAAPPLHYWEINDGANDAEKYADTGNSGTKLHGTASNNPTISTDVDGAQFVDVDLNSITNYTIPAHSGLLYLNP